MLRRYPVVKIYTQAELDEYDANQLIDGPAENVPDNPAPFEHVGSSSCMPEVVAETEFFTPTTKTVIEELSPIGYADQTKANETTGVKRILAYGEGGSGPAISPVTDAVQSSLSPERAAVPNAVNPSDYPLQATPSKKLKGKDQET